MYKGKRYRIGGGTSKLDATKSTVSGNLSTLTSATNPPITSTPNKPVAGPSNILTQCSNLPSTQSLLSQQKPLIISNDDDFAVPASQVVQPSRYISQRSAMIRSQMTYTQTTPLSYYESVLNRCGVEFTSRKSDISHTLNCDHLKFVIRLRRELTSHPKYPENIQNFLSGLIETMKDGKQLAKILSGCMVTFRLLGFHFF